MTHQAKQDQSISRTIRFSREMMDEIKRRADANHRNVLQEVELVLEAGLKQATAAPNCATCRHAVQPQRTGIIARLLTWFTGNKPAICLA
jgi:hypothetical protein